MTYLYAAGVVVMLGCMLIRLLDWATTTGGLHIRQAKLDEFADPDCPLFGDLPERHGLGNYPSLMELEDDARIRAYRASHQPAASGA